MKKHEIAAIAVLLAFAGWVAGSAVAAQNGLNPSPYLPGSEPNSSGSVQAQGGSAQTFNIKVVNGYYEPREIRVMEGTAVRLALDPQSFVGCMSVFNIWGLGQKITVSQGNNVLEFVADKPGTYKTSCNMGMGAGTFIVEPKNGSATPVQNASQAPAAGETCGLEGSCGCGGARN
ncbi:MAG: cupredoxin domain-containing protein [Candidatus Micrarchaeia archaeon]